MADPDSNDFKVLGQAVDKNSKQQADTNKTLSALNASLQAAIKATQNVLQKPPAQPTPDTSKAIAGTTETIKKSLSASLNTALNNDGKVARDARMKARNDFFEQFRKGIADTTVGSLSDGARSLQLRNPYAQAFVGGLGSSDKSAEAAVAGDGKTAAGDGKSSTETESDVAKSTSFMIDLASQAGTQIRANLGDMLFQSLDGNFAAAGKSFRKMLRQMLADAAASQISKLAGSALGMLGNAIGGLFGGGSYGSLSTSWAGQSGSNILGGGSYTGSGSTSIGWPGFAHGGVFLSGREMHAFARGGVVNGPTMFPMARGTGLMGEAGPEAIMPLTRGSDGKLGVQSSSSASGGVSNQISITVNVGNDGSRSDTQGQSDDAGRQLAAMVEGKVKEVMTREQRQGGILWRMQHG
ncbi:hypothetical protein [Dyella silvatica]|uniref:hypothetical protein n=1 Tax=Dyella silvatica TaxID=2992128 RepID=UPI00225B5B2B|nr:hypothetical protein [Dyella silvatica]